MATLKVLSGPTAGHCFDITADQAVVGRDMFCEIVLPSHSVSRQHARIVREAGNYFIEDLGSLNGTYVNGARVTRRMSLNDQDRIHIYETVLSFSFGPPLSEAVLVSNHSAVEPTVDAPSTMAMHILGSLDGARARGSTSTPKRNCGRCSTSLAAWDAPPRSKSSCPRCWRACSKCFRRPSAGTS